MSNSVRVRVHLADSSTIELEVMGPGATLIGRAPDIAAVNASGPIAVHVIAAPGISKNHVLVRRTETAVQILDLHSRNGTSVRLPPGVEAVFAPCPDEISLDLAAVTDGDDISHSPPPAHWRDAEDFPVALARAIQLWLAQVGEDAELSLSKREASDERFRDEIPLADGLTLKIRPLRTVDASWATRLEALWRYVEEHRRVFAAEEASRDEGMVLSSTSIRASHQRVVEAARRQQRLVLLGPTGVGKEELARLYHRHAARSGPFVAVNCGQLDRDLLRAELFGAEAGSFTGSVRRIVGAVEHASGGTLFLDEIGEMPADVQPMLLRFLDRGEYTRLGAYDTARKSDALVVCATNRDLRAETQAGRFREDLWFRLSIEVVEVEGLAARFEDVTAFLAAQPVEGASSILAALSDEGLDVLRRHPWAGNFRELANFAARCPRTAPRGGIDAATCRALLERGAVAVGVPRATVIAPEPSQWESWSAASLAAFEDDHDGRPPASWDEVKEYVERYLKPLLMVGIGGLRGEVVDAPTQKHVRRLADSVQADRGTALKQLARYIERYR